MVDSTTTVQIPASTGGSGATVQLPTFQQLLGLGDTSAPLVHESALFQMTPPDPAIMLSHRLPLQPTPTPPPLPSILQPVAGLPAYQMPSMPLQGYARDQLIAQAPSDWVDDTTPQPAPRPRDINPAPAYGVNPQQPPDNWQPPSGPTWGYSPEAVYKNLGQQRVDTPETDAYTRLLRGQTVANMQVANAPPPTPAPYVGYMGYQQAMAAAAPPGSVPVKNYSPRNMWRNFSHGALTGFNASLGQQENYQNKIIQAQNDSALQAWASRTNNASTNAMQGAKALAEEQNKKAAKFYEKMMELGAKFLQVQTIDNMHTIMKHVLGSTMPNTRAREDALRAYSQMLHMNLVTPENMNAMDQEAIDKFKKDAEDIRQKQLQNEYDQSTLTDRIAEKKADSRKAVADANVAEKTQQAKIDTANAEAKIKMIQAQIDEVYAEPSKRQALINQMAQTDAMLRNSARAAFDGTQKQIQDYNNLEKQKMTALQLGGKEGQAQAARIEQEIQDLYGARPHGMSKPDAFYKALEDPMNAMGLRPFLPDADKTKPNPQISRDAWQKAYAKASTTQNPYAQGLISRIDEAGMSAYLKSASGAPSSVQGLYKDLSIYGNKLKQIEAQGLPPLPETIQQRKERFYKEADQAEIRGASHGVMAAGELAPPMQAPGVPPSAIFLAGSPGPDGLAASQLLDKAGYKDKPIDWNDPLIREAFYGEAPQKRKK